MIDVINYIIKRFKRADLLKHKMSIVVAFIIFLLLAIGFSLGLTCLIVRLITMCFGLEYKFVYVLGVWLVMWLFNIMRGR